MIAESEDITDIGNYWDNKGENEIDLIALNRFENKALIAEVKRNFHKVNIARLYEKVANNKKTVGTLYAGYKRIINARYVNIYRYDITSQT